MKRLKKALALLLVFCMVLGMTSVIPSKTAEAAGDDFYKIVHLDAGRKYFSPDNIKKIIDNAAGAGYNQVELYLADNQGFRFALKDMKVTTSTGNTYDLTPALGDGYTDGSKYPDYSGKYLTQTEMTDLIAYAKEKGIDIVPCINVPGHMGAILEEFQNFCYSGSKSSIDLENEEAVAFALAITEKYTSYFASQGVKYYNLGADEYANDLSTMGFQGLYTSGKYQKFVEFLNSAAQIVIDHGMTPRAFNDGICYNNNTSYKINKSIEVCYWSSGWNGYNVASAATLNNAGYKLINTHGDYYWVLGNSGWQCSADKASGFNYKSFQGGNIDNPAGAMFCIWCDVGSADGQDDGTNVVNATADVIKAFGATLPGAETPSPEENTVTCENGTISVTAAGLTGLTCAETVAPAIEAAAEGKIKAYEVTPQTAAGAYTGEGKVSIAVPETWDTSKLGAFIVTDGVVEKLTGSYADGRYAFTAPHFSTMGIYEKASNSPVEVTNEETINITVGHTTTATISGANYAGDYTTEDPAIATVKVTGEDATEATETYIQATNVTCNTLISTDSTSWKRAGEYYYRADDGNYYPLYAKRSSDGFLFWYTYTYTWGYSTTSSINDVTEIKNGTQKTDSTSTEPDITVYTKSVTEGTPASTTVTFTGVAAGTTYVTVGNTHYTIIVAAEDLSKVTPLTVEYWITNVQVTGADGAKSKTIKATDLGIYTESGVALSDLVPPTGTANDQPDVFWKGTCLDSDNKQTTGGGVDKTKSGTDFTYIRYWDGKWSYSNDRQTWSGVNSSDQVVAYYLQKTTVTDEVTTYVVDWGPDYNKYTDLGNYVLLDFAVKYESGERVPESFPNKNEGKKTIGFHCDTSSTNLNKVVFRDGDTYYRHLGMIKGEETSEYEIYMITLTPTSDTKTEKLSGGSASANSSYSYAGTEKVVWVDDESNLNTELEKHEDYTVGGDPIVPELKIYNKQGMLVTYYVRAKVTEDSLAVHYIDQTANREFYDYNIAVKSGTVFKEGIGLADDGKGNLVNGSVTNLQGNTQTVSADLSTMPAIGAQYRYSDYTCIEVKRSDDGKDVYLYYTFNDAHEFVIDFGLQLNITKADIGIGGDWTFAAATGAQYGTATVEEGTSIKYIPNEVLQGVETLQLTLTGTEGSITHRIYIYPATTVYYEEGYATPTQGFTDGSKGTGVQRTEKVGTKANVYGYDPVYDVVGASNGTQAVSSTYGDKTSFTFTGTGVGIYANCDGSTGSLMIQVKDAKTNKLVMVKTALLDGMSNETEQQGVMGYNVPVTVINGLEHSTYTVTIAHIKPNSTATGDTVYFDGFRVYGTLDANTLAHEAYRKDSEDKPEFVELRDAVLTGLNVSEVADKSQSQYADQVASEVMNQVYEETGGNAGAVVLSENGFTAEDLKDLLDNGPKNELYLWPNQSVVFKVNAPDAQIGLKALNGPVTYTITGKDGEQNLNTSTDMFYSLDTINGAITLTNKSGGILSVTEIKAFGVQTDTTVSTMFMELDENDLVPALMTLGYELEPSVSYADATVNIHLNDYAGATVAEASLVDNGEEGTDAVFTAEEIKAAIEQALPEGYALVDEVEMKDQATTYGGSIDVTVQVGKVATLKVTYKNLFGKTVGTATLTGVQTSRNSQYTFSASEIRKAAPSGYWTGTLIPTKVKYGSTGTRTVIGF